MTMFASRRVSFVLLVSLVWLVPGAATAWGQAAQRDPHIGYVYPSGGQQGAVLWITVGGQQLGGVSEVCVSGAGVHAASVRFMGQFRPLDRDQREELLRRLKAARERLQGKPPAEEAAAPPQAPAGGKGEAATSGAGKGEPATPGAGKKPGTADKKDTIFDNHPLLKNLDNLSLRELDFLENGFLRFDRRAQPNAQIAETAFIELHIDPGAAPGDRELRLRSPRGLTNPLCFQVGSLPEVCETDPYDARARDGAPLALPIVLNGQIRPGDVDRFCFRAEKGQRLVIETHARQLIPFLADAVPGWFQASVTLVDAKDREVAFADHYRFAPDPVLFVEVPETGVYKLEIRDSLYRGREDFVYRVSIGELPFITSLFPLGGVAGKEVVATVAGWNLGATRLPLDTQGEAGGVRTTALVSDHGRSNSVTYAVDDLPECEETEPNDTPQAAQSVTLPVIVNGRIGRPGDQDVFAFNGKAGDEVVAEVVARRLQSPLDSLLALTDSAGQVLAWNDDLERKDGQLRTDMDAVTHHADSYLRFKLPADGVYRVQVGDAQQGGGAEYAYRLRLGAPRPDFALRVTPSNVNVRGGAAAVITAYVLRKDGFEGAIDLRLKDAPAGFVLQGGRIPGGRDRVRVTLAAPSEPQDRPLALELEGHAMIAGQEVVRHAVPAEDMMQAFLYRHLVPAQELAVSVLKGGGRLPPPAVVGETPVRIPVGGTARVRIQVAKGLKLENLKLELSDPPKGVSVQEVTVVPGRVEFELKAEGEGVKAGLADNLIIEAFMERAAPGKDGKPKKQSQRVLVGVLPAIPFEIVER